MPELTETAVAAPSSEMVSLIENLQKQKLSAGSAASLQNIINSSSSTSSVQETSSSQQVTHENMHFRVRATRASFDACMFARCAAISGLAENIYIFCGVYLVRFGSASIRFVRFTRLCDR